MNTPTNNDATGAGTPMASDPNCPQQDEQENTMIAQRRDNPFPVDPTGPLTKGRVPDADLDRLIQATVPASDPIDRLRSSIADVEPGQLEAADISALIDLIGDALDSGSEWAVRMRANDEARIASPVVGNADEPLPGFDW